MSTQHSKHSPAQAHRTRRERSAFTLPEVLVVAGVIALLVAVLLPALKGGLDTANMAKSQNNLKQIFSWMQLYASENREYILPSQFDYTDPAAPNATVNDYPVKVRSDEALDGTGWKFKGTWTDILWTQNDLGKTQKLMDPAAPGNLDRYLYDSPDKIIYEDQSHVESPFRSSASNSKDAPTASNPIATPYGTGAQEGGLPGYFAANNFFNTTGPTGNPQWWTTGQIKDPSRSMYLVDSWAGETIEAEPPPFDNADPPVTLEVDFRYNGVCLMLFLDGHSAPVGPWTDLDELEEPVNPGRVKVRDLHQN